MDTKFYTNVFSRGDKIYVRGYENGNRFSREIKYKPYLFIGATPNSRTPYKDITGRPVDKKQFQTIREAKNYIERYKDVSNMSIYGLTNFMYVHIYDEYHGEIKYDPDKVNIISLDIETDSSGGFPDIEKANKEITAITLSRRGEKVVLGLFPYKPKTDKVTYIHCDNEVDLLRKFLKIWQMPRFTPDIVTGWNIEFFDIPYIVNRITAILASSEAKKLSPWGILEERTIEIHNKQNQVYMPAGISVLDYLPLYKKFKFQTQESYKLENIANVEKLNVKKLDYKEHGYTSLDDLYKRNFELFIDYNIQDTTVIDLLEEKLKFIDQVMAFAYDAKVNYNDTLTTVRPWDIIIHNYLLDRGIVIPAFFEKGNMEAPLMGGYVKEPRTGMTKWVVSFDLNSLYPHLIMQYNISPDTFEERLRDFPNIETLLTVSHTGMQGSEFAYAANGTCYTKKFQGFLSALMEKMYNDRVEYKKKMIEAKKKLETFPKDEESEAKRLVVNDIARYHNLQLAKKIQLNSAYGALANPYFRWFNFDMAEAITMSGQLSIRWIGNKMNEYLNKLLKTVDRDYVIASDTDSIYITLADLVKDIKKTDQEICSILDKFIEDKIQPFINKCFEELANHMNAHKQKMFMKRETIANKGIWKAKKMYILNALDVEGVRYVEPELKIQGIEAVRSSTPKVCRDKIKQALKIIMNEDEQAIQNFIEKFRNEFKTLDFEQVAFPRGVNNMIKYADKKSIYGFKTPIHVKGALIHNHMVRKLGLTDKYQIIGDGDKIKFCYLKQPNPAMDQVISCLDGLPPEFGLERFIDYNTQFEKSFNTTIRKY
jgi:DNA polymerase elongation subunit (family B)